jgi:hypothetical protein
MGFVQVASAYDIALYSGKRLSQANIRIGGNPESTDGKFVPNINMHKWRDESWINLNFPAVITSQKETFDGEKIILVLGDYNLVYYPKNADDLEFEYEFLKRPESDVIEIDMLFSPGLEFFYQPALTSMEIDNGAERPENVVGSYAVYAGKIGNKYQTGKFCHFYYPYLIDADGKKTRAADFVIDTAGGKMLIRLPPEWMKNARYPVTLDPTLGYTSGGATNQYFASQIWGSSAVASEDGTVTKMSSYWLSYSAGNVGVAYYTNSGGQPSAKVAEDSGDVAISGATPTWYDNNISGAITGGNTYWLLAQESAGGSNNALRLDTASGAHVQYNTVTFETWASTLGTPSNSGAYLFSIYATYTASAGLEQEGYRFRYDNGDEDEATWAEAQDTNITAPKNVNKRLRFIINTTGDQTAKQIQLECKKSTEPTYKKVT